MIHKLGIVLSGGGARGVAHAGVIKALQEHEIEVDIISGTSSGAIVGALFAADYSPEEILHTFEENPIFKISHYTFSKPGFFDVQKFRPVLEKYFPDDQFSALKRKLIVTATDLEDARTEIFVEGPLIDRLLASSAYPVVFTPMKLGNRFYGDGGILDSFPVKPLLGACETIIGVYVNPVKRVKHRQLDSTLKILQRSLEMSISGRAYVHFPNCDLVISPVELADFSLFNVKNIERIYEIGYQATLGRIEEIKELLASKRQRIESTDKTKAQREH